MENEQLECGETSPFAGFVFPVSGFRFSIILL